jgi:hypothetical protein
MLQQSALDKSKISKKETEIQILIQEECNKISTMLCKKNKSYGNAALDPIKVFSKSDWEERINVRIDDKLNRIMKSREGFEEEDTLLDLIGYLILKRVGIKFNTKIGPILEEEGD